MNAKKMVAVAKHSRKTNIKLGSLFLNTVTPFTCEAATGGRHFYMEGMGRHEIPVNKAGIKHTHTPKTHEMILIKQHMPIFGRQTLVRCPSSFTDDALSVHRSLKKAQV